MLTPDGTPKSRLQSGALDPADSDPLTGLWNRRRFEDELARRITRSQRVALLSIDVDRYREVIQQHGAVAAEGLIRSIAEVLANSLAPNRTLARLGGDEFAAILSGTTAGTVQSLADDLCKAVREHSHAVGASRVHATISIGATIIDPGMHTHPDGLAAANTALHEAKISGSDRAILHCSS